MSEPPDQRLQHYLSSELYDRIVRDGSLPPALLAQECVRLRTKLQIVASFIPYPLVHRQLAHPTAGRVHGAFWYGSLLVGKITGLNRLCEQLSVLGEEGAEEARTTISSLLDGLIEDVHTYSGGLLGSGLLKFSGNTFTAFFDDNILERQHAAHAVNAALAIQARMAPYTTLKTQVGTFKLGLQMGVHSGQLFAAEVGEGTHLELITTGRQINRVTLAQELALPGEIVITEETRALLEDANSEEFHPRFYRLDYVPKLSPPPAPKYWGWESGANTMANLRQLVDRLDVLCPYLPHGFPEPMLDSADHTDAPVQSRSATALCVHFYPFNLLLDQIGDDPDLAARTLNAYYRRVQTIVERYDGSINKVELANYGDRLMAVFGAPTAHEDDPLRAVCAALDLREALQEANTEIADTLGYNPIAEPAHTEAHAWAQASLPHAIALSHRIGISTGAVLAGQVGNSYRRNYTVIGAPIRLAARLAVVASDEEVWLGPHTHYRVARHVHTRAAPPMQLPEDRTRITPAIVERLYPPHVGAAGWSALRASMVGRDAELQLLLDRAALARQGQGQVVALIGEAGLGKTRLIEEVLQQLVFATNRREPQPQPFQVISIECQSYDQSSPYLVVRELLRQLLTVRLPTDAHQFYALLADRLKSAAPAVYRFAPVLRDLLDLPEAETALTASLPEDQRHQRIHDLILTLLQSEARRHPLVVVIDDLHWADASSFEAVEHLARLVYSLPVLFVLGYRPGWMPTEPWRGAPASTTLFLQDISPEQRTTLVASLLGGAPPHALMAVLEQAQGNPFFIEELIYNLMEQGILRREADQWQLGAAPDSVALSYGIKQVITARLNRLAEPDCAVVQSAAVIGRAFSATLLASILPEDHWLPQRLAKLEQSGLIRSEHDHFVFRHTLFRDVTYAGIPYARRRELHQLVATCLAALDTTPLELLARHTLLAEDWGATFAYHLAAGRQVEARHASHEALGLYETALAIVPRLDPVPHDQLFELYERLGDTYGLLGQNENALNCYDQALALCKHGQVNASIEDQVRLRRQTASVHERLSDFQAAVKWLESAMALAGNTPSLELTRCLLLEAGIRNRQGEYALSLQLAQQALSLAEQLASKRDQAHALKLMAGIHGHLGDTLSALDLTTQSLQLYREIQDLQGQAGALSNMGIFLYEQGRWADAVAHYTEATHLIEAVGSVFDQAMIANNLGDVLRSSGDLDKAITQYKAAQQGWQHSPLGSGIVAMNLGATYLQSGDLELAAQQFERSDDLFTRTNAEGFLPELWRYQAELALACADTATALAACATSLDYARRLGARMEEGATRRVLGQIHVLRGDLAEAAATLVASLEALRETDSRYEIARTQLEVAVLAPLLHEHDHGQQALTEALETFQALGARLDAERARRIAQNEGYTVELVPDEVR